MIAQIQHGVFFCTMFYSQLVPFHPACAYLHPGRKRRQVGKFYHASKPQSMARKRRATPVATVLACARPQEIRVDDDPEYLCRVLLNAKRELGDIVQGTTWAEVNAAQNITKAEVNDTSEPVACSPRPDPAFTPCDDLMTWVWLRVIVWLVFLFGLTVNLFVFLAIAFSTRQWDTYRELTLNLILGDLFIAIFLGMLAAADLYTKDDYAAQALGWQKGAACKSAGFLSVLGSQLIMSTLLVITIERFYRITNKRHRALKLKHLRYALALCWVYSLLSAAMPLFGFSDYSTVATCMPFEAADLRSEIFLAVILALDFTMCATIVVLYSKVTVSTYRNSLKIFTDTGNVHFQKQQFRTLKRSAPLVICNLLCVVPIAVIGLLSVLLQSAQIDNRVSKIVLVIVYPINCLANPILYGFGRKYMFNNHMYDFLYRRLGLCEKRFLRRRSQVFSSPNSSRRGSIDSSYSGMTTLRRGLSLPVAILTTNTPSFQRSVSEPAGQTEGQDSDSAYSSNDSNSHNLRQEK